MPVIKDKPADLPPENDLENLPDDLLGPVPAVIRMSGKDLTIMDKPPEMGEFVKMEITMRCKKSERELLADGGIGHYRVMLFVAAKVTTEAYKPDPDEEPEPEPGLFDEHGNVPDDEGQDEDGPEGDDEEHDRRNPAFSHNGKVE